MKRIPPPPKNDLEQMYLVDKKSSHYIADKYNCAHTTVLRWLHAHKIPVRTYYKEWGKPTKEILEELYIDRHVSTTEIGKMYGVTSATVLGLLRYYKIEVRKKGRHKHATCDILKKHAVDLKDDPERLSTEFMQNLIGVECKECPRERI